LEMNYVAHGEGRERGGELVEVFNLGDERNPITPKYNIYHEPLRRGADAVDAALALRIGVVHGPRGDDDRDAGAKEQRRVAALAAGGDADTGDEHLARKAVGLDGAAPRGDRGARGRRAHGEVRRLRHGVDDNVEALERGWGAALDEAVSRKKKNSVSYKKKNFKKKFKKS
jgi:hypothetical protein